MWFGAPLTPVRVPRVVSQYQEILFRLWRRFSSCTKHRIIPTCIWGCSNDGLAQKLIVRPQTNYSFAFKQGQSNREMCTGSCNMYLEHLNSRYGALMIMLRRLSIPVASSHPLLSYKNYIWSNMTLSFLDFCQLLCMPRYQVKPEPLLISPQNIEENYLRFTTEKRKICLLGGCTNGKKKLHGLFPTEARLFWQSQYFGS